MVAHRARSCSVRSCASSTAYFMRSRIVIRSHVVGASSEYVSAIASSMTWSRSSTIFSTCATRLLICSSVAPKESSRSSHCCICWRRSPLRRSSLFLYISRSYSLASPFAASSKSRVHSSSQVRAPSCAHLALAAVAHAPLSSRPVALAHRLPAAQGSARRARLHLISASQPHWP